MNNLNYKEIEFDCGINIEEAVNELLRYKNRNLKVYGSFNGHKLYSDTVTLDNAYKKITGYTKKDYDEKMKKEYEENKRYLEECKLNAAKNIPNWIECGHKILSKDKWDLWNKIVPIRAKDLYNGFELDCTLEIEKILNKRLDTSFKEAKYVLENQGHSGMSYNLVLSMIKDFCTDGEDFVKYMMQ